MDKETKVFIIIGISLMLFLGYTGYQLVNSIQGKVISGNINGTHCDKVSRFDLISGSQFSFGNWTIHYFNNYTAIICKIVK